MPRFSMTDARERVARAIYAIRPAMQPWDGNPFEFDEPGARLKRDLAYRQADAAILAREEKFFDRCIACGVELKPVFDRTSRQYHNALDITLNGGFGEFFDNGSHNVFLCHDCAHLACLNLPWLDKLINPARSHGHTAEFWEFNNGHLGRDKPK